MFQDFSTSYLSNSTSGDHTYYICQIVVNAGLPSINKFLICKALHSPTQVSLKTLHYEPALITFESTAKRRD